MSEYAKYRVVQRQNAETFSAEFWAHRAAYGPIWVRFYKTNYGLFKRATEVARFRRSSIVLVSKEAK